jgi:GNAT superfamily N-acetyltransferase
LALALSADTDPLSSIHEEVSMSLLHLSTLCRQLEQAQAEQNHAFVKAYRRFHPNSQAESLALAGGYANFLAPDHPLNQAVAIGFGDGFEASDLDRMESHLQFPKHPAVVDLTPGADPNLAQLLSQRNYRVQQFQMVWLKELMEEPECRLPQSVAIVPVSDEQADAFAQVVCAGFMEQDTADLAMAAMMRAGHAAEGNFGFMALLHGEPVGGGNVGLWKGVATLAGTSVLPKARGRGIQLALIQARLRFAFEQGCRLASTSTLPMTASHRSMEKAGFRAAYPKLEMIREA